MILSINLPDNLVTALLLQQRNIPCVCRVSTIFEVSFQAPLPEAVGTVDGWDRKQIDDRAQAAAGGKYIHYAPSQITLKMVAPNQYHINDLAFFNRTVGWCPIIVDGKLAEAGLFWDDDEEDIDR
jgi:hypothetical protein